MENLPEARPQAGLDKADIVYEEPVEGGITRFIVLFQSKNATRVGPVRSARLTDSTILPQYGHPAFGYAGGVPSVMHAVDAAGVKDENYNECFSNALVDALKSMLENDEFRSAMGGSRGGRNRRAALAILRTLSRCATIIETLAVMPGLSFSPGLLTSMIVS